MNKKQKKELLKKSLLGIVFITLLGSVMHFTYEWSGENLVVGLISPVNESVWEHSKLFILPLLAWGFVEYATVKKLDLFMQVKLIQFVFMSMFITSFFYLYTGAFGLGESLAIDIFSFVLAVIIGQLLSYKLLSSKTRTVPLSWTIVAYVIVFGLFVLWTFQPPELPLFQSA